MTSTYCDLDDLTRRLPASATLAAPGGPSGSLPFAGHASLGSRMLRAVVRAAETVRAWHERSRQRGALTELSDYMLCDIGISRAEAIGEGAKPFWRD